jgi:hypothetical protein
MANTYVTSNPAVLDGYQSIFEANKFNKHSMQIVIDDEHIDALTEERPELIEWAKSKAKTKRVNVRLEPWEEVATGKYKVKFSWNPEIKIPIIDAHGKPITDALPLYSGSTVKVAFQQKPYAMPDSVGTALRLKAIQIVTVAGGGMSDAGSLNEETAAALFGTTEGFSIEDPNVKVLAKDVEEDSDF